MQSKYKLSILSPIGTSPPVVTEFVQYVENCLHERISDLTVISTTDPYIRCCVNLVEQAILDKYPHIHFHIYELGFEDVDSEANLHEFMIKMAWLLKEQVKKHRVDKIYINAAGGRKNALIALTTLSQLFPVSGIFHIIMSDVKTFNIELERIKDKIEGIGEAKDKRGYYIENKKFFEPVMYPPLKDYYVIKIPIIPYPKEHLEKLSRTFKKGKTPITKTGLTQEYIELLKKAGIIYSSRKYIYPKDEARLLSKIMETIIE